MSYETTLSKLKGIDIMFSDHKIIKPEFDNRNIPKKKLFKYFEINSCIKKEITKDIFKCLDLNENKNTIYQNLWKATKTVLI